MKNKSAKAAGNAIAPGKPGISGLFWGALALLPFVCLALAIAVYGVDIPYLDQWDFVPLLKKTFQGGYTIGDFWAPHNEHRLLFPQFISAALAHLSAWNIYYEMTATVLFAAGFFWVIVLLFKRSMLSLGGRSAGWVIPIVSLIVFSLSQWENWSWGGQLALFLGIFTFSAAVAFLLSPAFRPRDLLFAVLSGIVSTCSFANGLLVWPIGLFIIFSKDRKKITSAAVLWLLASVFMVLLYFHGYSGPSDGSSAGNIFSRPLDYLAYALKFLGSPLNNASGTAAFYAGSCGAALFFCLSFILLRSRKTDLDVILPYLALGAYSVGSALLSGFGRAGFGSDYALASRYITFSSPLWVVNVVFLAFLISGEAVPKAWKYISISILLAIVFMLLSNSLYGERLFNARYLYLAAARDEILSNNNDDFLLLLHPRAGVVKEGLASLKQYHLSVYREEGKEIRPLSDENKLERIKNRFDGRGRVNPYLDEVCARLGMLYYKQGRPNEVEFLWGKALEINPNYYDIYRNLIIFYLSRGNMEQARIYIGKMRDRGMPVEPALLKEAGK